MDGGTSTNDTGTFSGGLTSQPTSDSSDVWKQIAPYINQAVAQQQPTRATPDSVNSLSNAPRNPEDGLLNLSTIVGLFL